MAYGTRADWEELRSLDFGDISSSYASLGTPFEDHTRIIKVTSTLNQHVYLTNDTTKDKEIIPSNSFILIDFTANKVKDDGLFLPVGTQISVKSVGADPTSGSIYLSVIVAKGGV